jgi:hypothetical protein
MNITLRNYTPKRTFVTKWDIEKDNNKTKQKSIQRERGIKYDIYEEEEETIWTECLEQCCRECEQWEDDWDEWNDRLWDLMIERYGS